MLVLGEEYKNLYMGKELIVTYPEKKYIFK